MNKDIRIAELEAENARLKNENEILCGECAKLPLLVKYYIEQLRLAVHRQFGASSEATELPEPLGLFNEAEVHAGEPELREKPSVTASRFPHKIYCFQVSQSAKRNNKVRRVKIYEARQKRTMYVRQREKVQEMLPD